MMQLVGNLVSMLENFGIKRLWVFTHSISPKKYTKKKEKRKPPSILTRNGKTNAQNAKYIAGCGLFFGLLISEEIGL